MHALCQLVDQNGKSSMRYQGTANSLIEILSHQGGENNLFYTVAELKQSAIPKSIGVPWKMSIPQFERINYLAFDIDGLEVMQDVNDVEHVCELWLERNGQPLGERHYVASGHGVHILIRIPEQTSVLFFKTYIQQYKLSCSILHAELTKVGITCKQVDPCIFEPSRLLRVPGTVNVKNGKEPVPCRLIESLGLDK